MPVPAISRLTPTRSITVLHGRRAARGKDQNATSPGLTAAASRLRTAQPHWSRGRKPGAIFESVAPKTLPLFLETRRCGFRRDSDGARWHGFRKRRTGINRRGKISPTREAGVEYLRFHTGSDR